MANEFIEDDGPVEVFPDLELKSLDELKAAVGWEIRSTEGRLRIKAGYDVLDSLSIYGDHFGFTPDDLTQLLFTGNIVVKDLSDGKEYPGKRIAAILGLVDPHARKTADARHAGIVAGPSPVGPSARVPQQQGAGGAIVASSEAPPVSRPSP